MKSKILIQFFLFLIVILISSVVYLNYFKKNNTLQSNLSKKNLNKIEKDNIIKKLEYKSNDEQGRKYIIKSEKGSIDQNNSDIIFMENVNARIILEDGTIVYISSNKAIYNNKLFNTNFEDNVKLKFLSHNLSSENLDLVFDENKIEVYNNLIYKNLDLTMIADKIEIDMITKYSKIFNFDEDKVKIEKFEK
tara:strand:+ start:1039 stop:1614 length:576 start_codon:yes stop_codon:yes gene_type:complete